MKESLLQMKDAGDQLYRVTDSGWTEYAAFQAYTQLMNLIAQRFPAAAPRPLSDFEVQTVETIGGDLPFYRELDRALLRETIQVYKPKFDLNIGNSGDNQTKISDIQKYVSAQDYRFNTVVDAADDIVTAGERTLIMNGRDSSAYPNAIIYRDQSSVPIIDWLAERFNTSMLAKCDDYAVNLSNTVQYKAEGRNAVDYIVVFVSESSLEAAFSSALS